MYIASMIYTSITRLIYTFVTIVTNPIRKCELSTTFAIINIVTLE